MTRHSRPPSRDALSRRGFLGAAAAALTAPAALRAGTAPAPTETRREISQHGVTFRFAAPRPVGRYVTGDWFVVGPVEIVAISPESRRTGAAEWNYWRNRDARVIHGAQLDYHIADRTRQGLDDIYWRNNQQIGFLPELNVDPAFTGRPLRIDRPATLIKAVSLPAGEVGRSLRPTLADMIFLTVVSALPPEGAFRPSAEPGSKASLWTENDLDWSVLPELPTPPGVSPELLDPRRLLAKNIRPQWNCRGRYGMSKPLMAKNNQWWYGREHAYETGYAGLALCSDRPRAEKRDLFIALVQQGLDVAAMIEAGRKIKASAGNSIGRALPLTLAARALGGARLSELADAKKTFATSEAGQFFYIGDDVIGKPRIKPDRPRGPYTEDMRGIPEYGGQHILYTGRLMQPERAGSHHMMSYRDIVSNALAPCALAACMMPGAVKTWNHPEFFDYMDRWIAVTRHGVEGAPDRLRRGNELNAVTAAYWRHWRELSAHPVHKARPAPMISGRTDWTLRIHVAQGAPLLISVAGGFIARPLLSQFRDRDLDLRARYDLRWSEDGETWTELRDAGLAPRRIAGLARRTRYFVQMRQRHPEHGEGPWSFDWWWWENDVIYDGRHSHDRRRWTESANLGDAQAAMRWLAETHLHVAPHVELRATRLVRKERVTSRWVRPFWLSPEVAMNFPHDLSRNSARLPSVTTA